MSRQDFQLIADTLKESFDKGGLTEIALAYLVNDFAAALQRTNPRFDRKRFAEACGVTE